MRAPTALPRFRARAESRMLSVARLRRLTGEPVRDPVTDLDVPEWAVTHESLPFRLGGASQGSATTRVSDRAGVEVSEAVRTGNLPALTDNVADNDYLEITAGEHVGLVFRVIEATGKDQATALRLPLAAVRRPEEWT